MTRTLTPWLARFPRLPEFDTEFPKWMTELFGPEPGLLGREGKFLPEVNMVETEKAVEVTVDLPGLKPEEVKAEVRDQILLITGERKEEKEEKGKTFHRMERRTGMFRRALQLPVEVVEDKIEAQFTAGVLKIILPKAERVLPRQIPIKG